MNLGYILISKRVLTRMYASESFAAEVGRAIRHHGISNALRAEVLKYGVPLVTRFDGFGIMTSNDKNQMPRTTVALDDEGCFL